MNQLIKITMLIFLTMFLWFLFMLMNYMMSEIDMTKSNTLIYECGFDSIMWSHSKINIQFFKIGLIFILFDLELMFLLLMYNTMYYIISLTILLFIFMTLLLEMYFKTFIWNY